MEYLQLRGLKWAAAALFACAGMAQAQTSAASLPPVRIAMVESLSGPFANTGEAVFRNILWAVERVNARGGVMHADCDPEAIRCPNCGHDLNGTTE